MNQNWNVNLSLIQVVQQFVRQQQSTPFVQQRIERNLAETKPPVSRQEFWKQLVVCILTTQQKSGPDSPISSLTRTQPFQLGYELCGEQSDLPTYVSAVLQAHGIKRFTNRLPKFLATNFMNVQQGLWNKTDARLEELRTKQDQTTERRTADFLEAHYDGIGPKQARNVLQCLGLTRYEIPIDSRIQNWLDGLGLVLEYKLSGSQYSLVMDDIIELCNHCNVVPCVLDACVFNSFDGDGWTEDKVQGVY